MSRRTLHSTPPWRSVMGAELRSVGHALRPTAWVSIVAATILTLVVSIDLARQGQGLSLFPEMAVLVFFAVSLLPIAVWKGEYRYRRSYLASMPVDRMCHVSIKIMAGWIWLMAAVGAFLVWMVTWAIATGGEIGVFTAAPAAELPPDYTPEEAAQLVRRLQTAPWQFTTFFTGATVSYLLGTAAVLAERRIRRWLAVLAIICFTSLFIDDQITRLGVLPERLNAALTSTIEGRYGLEVLLEAKKETMVHTAGDGKVIIWHALSPTRWLLTTLLWIAIALSSLLAVFLANRRG